MKKVGEVSWKLRSYSTCEYQGRVFHFSAVQGKLTVYELFFGDEVRVKEIITEADCGSRHAYYSSCCLFGDKVLVMAGKRDKTNFFCGLLSIDPGELTTESIHIEGKRVTGWEKYWGAPRLAQVPQDKVWASFPWSDEIWIGELKGDELTMTKHPDRLPLGEGFAAPTLRLPDGRFLVAGGLPYSSDIILITPGERFFFEKIGEMPGGEKCGVSIILVKERFVVGFGGFNELDQDDMWIFDLKTHKVSPVMKQGEWHPPSERPALVIRNQELYVIAGRNTGSVHSISLSELSHLILDNAIRHAFCLWSGVFPSSIKGPGGLELQQYAPACL